MTKDPLITIIIPAYNEEKRLPETLHKIVAFVEACEHPLNVIVVNNRSQDKTQEVAEKFSANYDFVQTIEQPLPGKGAAVRKGVQIARGEYIFICDADSSMPIEELAKFFPENLNGQYSIAIGSREVAGAKRYNVPWYRYLMGRAFNFLVRMLAVPQIHDTQCGYKSFRREVAQELFAQQQIDGWAFDVEVLAMALQRDYKVLEVGITTYHMPGSRIAPLQDTANMLLEVINIRRNIRAQVYKQTALKTRSEQASN